MSTKISKREVIVAEALSLFKEKGYAATTMRDIADKVGMEAASLYNHIKSKDELLIDICEKVMHLFNDQLQLIVYSPKSTIQKIEDLLAWHIDMATDYPSYNYIATIEWKHLPEVQRKKFYDARKRYEDHFLLLIETAMAEGIIHTFNPKVTLYTLLSSLRWIDIWFKKGNNLSKKTLKNDIMSLIFQGLINKNHVA